MAVRIPLPNLGPRMRKVVRIAGYVLLALVTFVIALQLTFPYDRVKARIEAALAEKYVVQIGEVERGWVPGRMYLKSITLQTRPAKAEDPVTTMFIDSLEVDVRFLPLLGGAIGASIEAEIGAGTLAGSLELSKRGTSVAFEGSNLQSQALPMREAIGLPMSGTLEFEFSLDLPNEKQKSGKVIPNWQKAEGSARIACPSGCTFGDGKTKLKTKLKNARNQAFAEGGIEFGKVTLRSLLAKVDIKTGTLKITQFDAPSDDGKLEVDYEMELQPVFGESAVTGCLRFNGSPALLQREPKTFSAITATGAPLGPDQLFHIRLTDKFKEMKRLGQVCGSAVSGKSMDNPGGSGARPTIQAPVDEPAKVIDAGAAPVTPPPTPEGATGADSGSATIPPSGPDMPGSAAPPGAGSAVPPGSGSGSGHGPADAAGSGASAPGAGSGAPDPSGRIP